jgi:hypothetical protein
LNEAIAEDRYALDTYQLLRGIPFYAGQADRLWAGLFERRAIRAAFQERRDESLLWWLKALSVPPSREEYRKAANQLIDGDYVRLVTTAVTTAILPQSSEFSSSMAFSSDCRRLAGIGDGRGDGVRVWDLEGAGAVPTTLLDAETLVGAVAFSPDSRRLAAGGVGVRVWDLERPGAVPTTLRDQGTWVQAVAFSPDSRRLAAGGRGVGSGVVRVWDLERPGAVPTTLRASGDVEAVAFSPDGASICIATLFWCHLVRTDRSNGMAYSSRMLPGLFPPSSTAFHFLGRSGEQIEVAVLLAGDSILPTTVRFNSYDAAPIPGDPGQLLAEWQRKLALKITDTGEIALDEAGAESVFRALAPVEPHTAR